MLKTLLVKVVGTQNERELKRLRPIVAEINALEPSMQALTDEQLRAKTAEFRARLATSGDGRSAATIEDLLPEAFAVVREAGRRVLDMRHFDVQLVGGMVLHKGRIAEMKTGEGKTLVATLPAYLNGLDGKGVHVVTVNDYLARRDSEWMGRIYRFLGMTVGVIQHDLNDAERQVAYGCDITYGTNNEFGFDYLRDNMKFDLANYVQRGHHFAIVDEVDSILIDEARTPLIISGPAEESTDLYYEVDRIIPQLKKGAVTQGNVKQEDREALEQTGDYIIDEKHKTVTLTESGMAKAERLMKHRLAPDSGGLYDPTNMPLLHHVNQALRAHTLFRLDVEYMIKDGQVVIVDEFTGRLMPGRRWSDGLHQAVEAKEKVKIERENQTLATITFQNYFRKYKKLSGMTGTAETEAVEFAKIYKLDVIVIPTNRPLNRIEEPDTVFRTEREKYEAIVNDILEKQTQGRPVLVGTVSIEKSEKLVGDAQAARHQARRAERQVPRAGSGDRRAGRPQKRPSRSPPTWLAAAPTSCSAATRSSWRGSRCWPTSLAERLPKGQEKFVDDDDYVYFYHLESFYRAPRHTYRKAFLQFKRETDHEHDEVVGAGGLHIIATERHEARRIDNQLRGRAGRQGDPGSSRFYLSLEDDLMRIFGSDRISGLMQRLGMEEGVPIEHGMVTRAIERAQRQVEAQNFSVRKHLLEYDDVMNKQRESVYGLRRELLEGKIQVGGLEEGETETVDTRGYLTATAEDLLDSTVDQYLPKDAHPEDWDINALRQAAVEIFALDPIDLSGLTFDEMGRDEIRDAIWERAQARYDEKEKLLPAEILRRVERDIMLQVADAQWKDHLYSLDHLKEGIGLRGYGQRDPLVEYKKESFALFTAMRDRVDEEMIRYLWRLRPVLQEEAAPAVRAPARRASPLIFNDPSQASPFTAAPRSASAVADHPRPARVGGDDAEVKTVRRDAPKVGRNDPCWCGSGKKFKKCHGANA